MVFIDNSNVFKYLNQLHKIDAKWPKSYDPKFLAESITGNRELKEIYFYCSPPPPYLQIEQPYKYWNQISYYEAVKQLPNLVLKYGRLTGGKRNISEKNLDTQVTADMIRLAAENAYDVAVLVSNDGDYQSAVETVKIFKKGVENVYFRGSVSMSLKMVCDVSRRARRKFFKRLAYDYFDGNTIKKIKESTSGKTSRK